MSHLDDLTAALVDNELSHDQRDRALSHIAGCDPCRKEVDAQRRLKALLANQADPEVSPDLTARLLALPRDLDRQHGADVVRGARLPRRPEGTRPPRRSLRNRAATASALGVALVAGVAAAGGNTGEGPRVRPPVETFVEEHTATTTDLLGPLNDPAGSIVLTSYGR
jgi:anti-sigma factor RsiW